MFVFKKLLGSVLMPLPLLLIILAGCLFYISRANKKSYGLAWLCLLSLWFISTPYVADLMITPIESQLSTFNTQKHKRVDKIVVLGCDVYPNARLHANAQLGGCALSRLTEGVRLSHHYKSAELIVSGQSSAVLMKRTAISLGITASRIRTNPNALDTKDEAKLLAPILVDRQVALVTSAAHMSRAKDLFEAQGIDTIAAPTQFFNFKSQVSYKQLIAQSSTLNAVTSHYYEVLGKAWISLRRWIDPEAL